MKHNIILIGMPGSGKSTIGRAVADAIGMLFLDVDDAIVRLAGKNIPDIFSQDGEPCFRNLETTALKQCCSHERTVIATGGGAILKPENRSVMRENGLVCHIVRNISRLQLQAGRPLSTDLETVKAMEVRRRLDYEAARHIVIDNNGDIQDAVDAIIGAYHEHSRH